MQRHGFLSKMVTTYGIVNADRLRPDYQEASLELLARYALDDWPDGNLAARLLLQDTVLRMSEHSRVAAAAEWAARLHSIHEEVQISTNCQFQVLKYFTKEKVKLLDLFFTPLPSIHYFTFLFAAFMNLFRNQT